jgi:tetratricopeptide (TPR) repeat protein
MKQRLLYIVLFFLIVIHTYSQAIPEAAREKYIMAITLRNQAKIASDYDSPISKLKDVTVLAPTWAEAYKELGLTFELAGKFDDAIANLTKYISFNPPKDDARKAQDEIYIIKAKKEKADVEKEANSPETIKKKEEEEFSAFLKKNAGAVFSNNQAGQGGWAEIVIDNGSIVLGSRHTDESWLKLNPDDRGKLCRTHRYTIKQFTEKIYEDDFYGTTALDASGNRMYRIWTFSKDGKMVTVNYLSFDNIRYDMIYKRVN